MTVLAWLLRLLLGGLFGWAGALKLRDPTAFAADIANYELLPWLAPYLAAALPVVELVLGLLLIAGTLPWRRAAALAAAGLMAVFTIAVAQAVVRGIDIDCGCFGGASGPVSAWTFARDLGLLAAAVALLLLEGRPARLSIR